MALITCPECGKEISEFANFCVHCGCPMKKIVEINKKNAEAKKNLHFYEKLDKNQKLIVDEFIKRMENLFDPFYKANYKNYLLLAEGYVYNYKSYCYFCFNKNKKLLLKYDRDETRYEKEINYKNFDDCIRIVTNIYRTTQVEENNDIPMQPKRIVANQNVMVSNYSNAQSGWYFVIKNEANNTYFENFSVGTSFVGRDDIGLSNRETYKIANFGSNIGAAYVFHTENGANDVLKKLKDSFPKVIVLMISK